MAVDTAAKRNSALNFAGQYIVLPIPDGTVAQADRQTLLGVYGGILAVAVALVGSSTGMVKNIAQPLVQLIATRIGK